MEVGRGEVVSFHFVGWLRVSNAVVGSHFPPALISFLSQEDLPFLPVNRFLLFSPPPKSIAMVQLQRLAAVHGSPPPPF